jgi:hypothetical protein
MAGDFTVVIDQPQHFGSNRNYFGAGSIFEDLHIDSDLAFVGAAAAYSFVTPDADSNESGILLFEAFDVTVPYNVIEINGSRFHGIIPACPRRGEWQNNMMIIPPDTLSEFGPNTLRIETRSDLNDTEGNCDNLILTNVVVMYKTGK